MAKIDQSKNEDFDICWARGDDDPKVFTIKDSAGVVVDISGWTLALAVNPELDPADDAAEVFRVSGSFVTDGTDGKISFTPPANSLDNITAPDTAFYDVNRLTPSKKTLLKAKVLFLMDIDKA